MLSSLINMAIKEAPDSKGTLMLRVAELCLDGLADRSQGEKQLFADVILTLYAQADAEQRAALARQLAMYADIPPHLARHIAEDTINIAMPVLLQSEALTPEDMAGIAETASPAHLQILAHRPDLKMIASDVIVRRGDRETRCLITENTDIRLSRQSLLLLAEAAETDELLRGPLINRADLTPAVCQRMLTYVSGETRAQLLKALENVLPPEQRNQITRLRQLRKEFAGKLRGLNIRQLWREAKHAGITLDELVILLLQDKRLDDVCQILAHVTRRPTKEIHTAILDGSEDQVVDIALSAGLEPQTLTVLAQARCKALALPAAQAKSWTKAYLGRLEALRRAPDQNTSAFAPKRRGKHSKGRVVRNQTL
ncbi:DUF2336 domain-containing protein [Roseibium sp. RKSG952]|uniref:DUF2336 domain-containing protein n=1 Tax=Roseibium sp. RKSG952 TaxID=2529384 RepID=UPI0012BB5834|nr:DUF2336 domain-containing protein [Roseibium sp. RKSG952]MTH96754.1 DUF2336 domain-containing protein [Roseibium sp. RKSG952]